MGLKKLLAGFSALFVVGLAWAGNDSLAVTQTVPAGERVANYLQNYLGMIYTVVEAKNSGGLFEGPQTYRVVVSYDPDQKNLDVTLIGSQQDPQVIQRTMDVMRKITLKLNPKLQKDFGVTLQDGDLSMDYLYAKTGQVLDRYRDGKYLGPIAPDKNMYTPTPDTFSNP
jgi:hypothetical protein